MRFAASEKRGSCALGVRGDDCGLAPAFLSATCCQIFFSSSLKRMVLAPGRWIRRKQDGLNSDLNTAPTATTTSHARFVAKLT